MGQIGGRRKRWRKQLSWKDGERRRSLAQMYGETSVVQLDGERKEGKKRGTMKSKGLKGHSEFSGDKEACRREGAAIEMSNSLTTYYAA
ncbi:hypothetical protein NQZ68_035565 [Dissostichus eleginoides]|nr:hypothetical protein NQZ68_035565 [Dissostichus eleginoides]